MGHDAEMGDIDQRIDARPDLLERLDAGDPAVLADLFEVGLGVTVKQVTVRELA